MDTLTVWSLIGCSAIVFAFAVLSYDMFIHPSDDESMGGVGGHSVRFESRVLS